MKQKITLEIDNDTGIEFEEVAVEREVQEGDWVISPGDYTIFKWEPNLPGYRRFFVLTPKIDKELEEARKKFPVGSYVQHANYGSTKFLVVCVDRHPIDDHIIIITEGPMPNLDIERCTPFPIPIWRCCEKEKPKKDGEYFVSVKGDAKQKMIRKFTGRSWLWKAGDVGISIGYEWLDEEGE